MADSPWSMFSPFSQTFGRFLYDPVTNWQRFFNPQVVFNYNPQDQGVEAHVLERVGSYGSQLSTLIGAIQALKDRIDTGGWDDAGAKSMAEFAALRTTAGKAVEEYRGQIGADEIVKAAQALKARDPDAARALRERLEAALAPTG